MKKIFSFFAAMMLLVSTASATTIYCKMDKAWWTDGGAAIGLYTWDAQGTPKAAWPGDRMTPVAGEAGVWSFDLDLNTYKMCIFTRMNPSDGDNQDWGAKTVDLEIPTDGKNLFTITNDSATWGDPGCNGVWSVYGEAEMTAVYDWAGEIGTTVLGGNSNIAIASVKIHTNTDEVPAIKFGSSYVYADGKWAAIKPAEGGFKAGDVISVAAVYTNADVKYAQLDVYAADQATRLWRSDSASTINARLSADEPIVQTYTLEADQDSLLLGRYGNTGLFITMLKVERAAGETPQPENPIVGTYFATGDGWADDTESKAEWDAATKKVTVTIAMDKVAQWQAQVKYQAIASAPDKFYNFALKMKANHDVSGVTVKWDDNTGLVLKEGVALAANTEYAIDLKKVASNAAGNGVIVFDFGFAKATDVIEIYDIVVEEAEAPAVTLEDGYYIIGLNGWTIYDLTAANKFAANGEVEGEYTLTTTLAANNEFKVVSVANNELVTWYPAEAGNYVVDLNHAGEAKVVYFRPNYDGGEGWHGACIFVPENEAPVNPIDHVYFATGSGWAADDESSAVWDPETGKITVTLAQEKVAAWQGQIFINTIKAEVGKCYNFSVKMKSNKSLSGATIKWQENNNDPIMVSEINTISLTADQEFVYSKEQIAGQEGNGQLVYDFGYAEAGTIIEIYDLVIAETACAAPVEESVYYLVGSMTGWQVVPEAQYTFAATETEGEYTLTTTLTEGQGIKVVGVLGETQTWYPDGMGNEYVVDAAHAGEKTIYFRPAGNAEWAAFGGYIYIEATQGIENTAAEVKAVKTVINGQLVIIKGDKIFNATGAQIR